MQYEYFLKNDINGNCFIEFRLQNIHESNHFGKNFLDDLLAALKEINPSLKNDDNYWNFDITCTDGTVEDEIKNKFDNMLSVCYYDYGHELVKLVIETTYGEITLAECEDEILILTIDNNPAALKKINGLLENSILFALVVPGC